MGLCMKLKTALYEYFSQRDRGWILSLLFIAFCIYLPFLGSPLIFDDLTFFVGGVAANYAHSFFSFDLRWLPYASLGWTELAFSNVVTHFFHLGNLLLHAANAVLLFYLLRTLLGAVVSAEQRNFAIWGAWLAAIVFMAHPVAVYAVGYVVQRSILMATFFALLTQYCYLRGLLSGNGRWMIFAVLAYFMGVFAKEHSVLTLLLLAAETLLLRSSILASRGLLQGTWAALLATAVLVSLIAKGTFGLPYEPMAAALFDKQGVVGATPVLHGLSVLTQAGLFFKYMLLWLLPNPAWMSIDMREHFVSSIWSWQGGLGLLGFAGYGYFSIRLLLIGGLRGMAGFALLYPWLQFLLEFSSIRVQEPFVLYRSYIWMPGLLLLIPLLLIRWPVKRLSVIVCLLLILLVPASMNRLWVMADNYRLWDDAARLLQDERMAGADRIYFNRGQAAGGRGQLQDAIADYQRSLSISPQYAPVHFELGWAYALTKSYPEAMVEFETAIGLDPKFGNAYYGKALLLKMRGDIKQATSNMEKACELKVAIACLLTKGYVER